MNLTPSTTVVYQTADLSIFARINGNRDINDKKVKAIAEDIAAGNNLLPFFPLLTTPKGTKLEVLDGQHRLAAARKQKVPVHFIISGDTMPLVKMAKFNSLQDKWKNLDFINCYIENGHRDYGVLQDFIAEFELPVMLGVRLLSHGGSPSDGGNHKLAKEFKAGKFTVKHARAAREIMETCRRFKASKVWNTGSFATAITKILANPDINIDRLVERFNKKPGIIVRGFSDVGYLSKLMQLYNSPE